MRMGYDVKKIKESVDLREFISSFVKLGGRSRGKVMMGLCPFHGERTPSFAVYDAYFICYGCGVKGDIFGFVERYFEVNDGFFKVVEVTVDQIEKELGMNRNEFLVQNGAGFVVSRRFWLDRVDHEFLGLNHVQMVKIAKENEKEYENILTEKIDCVMSRLKQVKLYQDTRDTDDKLIVCELIEQTERIRKKHQQKKTT